MIPVIVMLLCAAPAVEANAGPEVTRSVGLDVLHVFNAAQGGDVVLPLEFDQPMWKRLRFLGRLHAAMATGAGAGLFALGGQVGFRWYVLSDEPLQGFHIGLSAGGDLPFTTSPFFGLPRPSATLSFGYGVKLRDRIQITPGIDLTPIGLGFPMVAPLTVHLGVAWGY